MDQLWNEIRDLISKSDRDVVIQYGNSEIGIRECDLLKIPIDTALYSVVTNTNGFIVDHWIHVFGQESSENYGITHYNKNSDYSTHITGLIIVASDIVGGLYAVDINRFSDAEHLIWYYAPDTLEWECINMKYHEFIVWILQGNIDEFYSTMRWSSWKQDCIDISMNHAMLVYPFLWAKECDIESASKKIVPLDEIILMNFDIRSNMK